MRTQRADKPQRCVGDPLTAQGDAAMARTKTLVATSTGVIEMDTVKIDDGWWLVCSWNDRLQTRPRRIVRLSGLPHEEVRGQAYRFVLSHPLPAELLADRALPGFQVRTLS